MFLVACHTKQNYLDVYSVSHFFVQHLTLIFKWNIPYVIEFLVSGLNSKVTLLSTYYVV